MHPLVQEAGTVLLHRLVREALGGEDEDATEVFTSSSRPKGPRVKGRRRRTTTTTEGPTLHHPEVVTDSTMHKFEVAAGDMLHTAADKSHIPFWGILIILLVIVLVIFVAFYFCLAKYWRKFKESDKGARFKGLDLKSVNLIGQLGKEKARLSLPLFTVAGASSLLPTIPAVILSPGPPILQSRR